MSEYSNYIIEAVEIMDQYSIYGSSSVYKSARVEALKQAQSAHSYLACHSIIRQLLPVAGGVNSFFYDDPNKIKNDKYGLKGMPSCKNIYGILYINMPTCPSNISKNMKKDKEAKAEYINSTIALLKTYSNLEGAIIDLRQSSEGDYLAMIAALSPFLPDGDILNIKYAASCDEKTIRVNANKISCGNKEFTVDSFKWPSKKPIFILIGRDTRACGEIVSLALSSIPNAVTIGETTAGRTSINEAFPMSDDSIMELTVASIQTMHGDTYLNEPLIPEIKTSSPFMDAITYFKKGE